MAKTNLFSCVMVLLCRHWKKYIILDVFLQKSMSFLSCHTTHAKCLVYMSCPFCIHHLPWTIIFNSISFSSKKDKKCWCIEIVGAFQTKECPINFNHKNPQYLMSAHVLIENVLELKKKKMEFEFAYKTYETQY